MPANRDGRAGAEGAGARSMFSCKRDAHGHSSGFIKKRKALILLKRFSSSLPPHQGLIFKMMLMNAEAGVLHSLDGTDILEIFVRLKENALRFSFKINFTM